MMKSFPLYKCSYDKMLQTAYYMKVFYEVDIWYTIPRLYEEVLISFWNGYSDIGVMPLNMTI